MLFCVLLIQFSVHTHIGALHVLWHNKHTTYPAQSFSGCRAAVSEQQSRAVLSYPTCCTGGNWLPIDWHHISHAQQGIIGTSSRCSPASRCSDTLHITELSKGDRPTAGERKCVDGKIMPGISVVNHCLFIPLFTAAARDRRLRRTAEHQLIHFQWLCLYVYRRLPNLKWLRPTCTQTHYVHARTCVVDYLICTYICCFLKLVHIHILLAQMLLHSNSQPNTGRLVCTLHM